RSLRLRGPDNSARSRRHGAAVRVRTLVVVRTSAVACDGVPVRPWAPTHRRACSSQSRAFGAGRQSRGHPNARVRQDANWRVAGWRQESSLGACKARFEGGAMRRVFVSWALVLISGAAFATPAIDVDGWCPSVSISMTGATPMHEVMIVT